jgi:hypothetical protein
MWTRYLKRFSLTRWLLLGAAALSPTIALGANYYVRSDATGLNNGSDWHNAYTSLPNNLARGNVYFVADGSYGSRVFRDAVSGSSYIEIRKATEGDHGTSVGWLPQYGDGVAYWGELSFQTSYYIFDGRIGYGRDVEPYGFQQNFTVKSTPSKALDIDGDFITIRHLKSYWDDRDHQTEVQSRWLDATTGSPSNITVSYAYVKELPGLPFYFISSANVLVEYFVLEGMHSDPTYHAEIASIRGLSNLTVRYCWFMDGSGTGGWMSMEGRNTDWRIYGNVFEQTSRGGGYGLGTFADNMGQPGSSTEAVFYNNTIANHTAGLRSGLGFWGEAQIESRNNISRRNPDFANVGVDVASHNYMSSSPVLSEFNRSIESELQVDSLDPFVDSARDNDGQLADWQLSGTNLPRAGYSLPAPYNESCIHRLLAGPNSACLIRGADGHWDRGAFEYVQSGRLSPPTNLRVN